MIESSLPSAILPTSGLGVNGQTGQMDEVLYHFSLKCGVGEMGSCVKMTTKPNIIFFGDIDMYGESKKVRHFHLTSTASLGNIPSLRRS